MANQYQIYEASLTAMCNMYRMANDSNEPIAIGELANKIRNYHKNPVYPEGCSIIRSLPHSYRIYNYITSTEQNYLVQSYSIRPLSEKPSEHTRKISLNGSAEAYGFCNEERIGYIYTDSPLYLARLETYVQDVFWEIGSHREQWHNEWYDEPNESHTIRFDLDYIYDDIPSVANVEFFKGMGLSDLGQIYVSYSINNLYAYNNLIGLQLKEGNSNIENWVKNHNKLQYFSYYNGIYSFNNVFPKYFSFTPYGEYDEPELNFPSMAMVGAAIYSNVKNYIHQSPYYFKANSPWENVININKSNDVNIKMCNDIVIAPNIESLFAYSPGISHVNMNGIQNIYLMSPRSNFGTSTFENNFKNGQLINIRGFNNEPIILNSTNFFSYTRWENCNVNLNIQDDIYFLHEGIILQGYYGYYNVSSVHIQYKNIFSPDVIQINALVNNGTCFVENIKANRLVIGKISDYNYNEIESIPFTINGVGYATNYLNVYWGSKMGYYSPSNYKIKLYAENNMEFIIYGNYSLDGPQIDLKGDYYLWAEKKLRGYMYVGYSSFNIHIRKDSLNWYQYNNGIYYTDFQVYGNNYGNGYVYGYWKKVGDGHYVEENYGRIHLYTYDSCPFEINKEIPTYDW